MTIDSTQCCGKKVLVTGATGFLGRRIVSALVERGCEVHGLTRSESNVELLRSLGVEPVVGDVAEKESLTSTFADVEMVIHAAADTVGTLESGRRVTIQGTQNVLELCSEHKIEKLVYVSSCSVYSIAGMSAHSGIDENSPLEPRPEQRGAYSWAKLEADKLVLKYMQDGSTPTVCLRPGTIYGAGGELFTPILGFSLKNKLFAVISIRHFLLPLVFVDNLVDAIVLALFHKSSDGQVYNVVDPERLEKRQYMQQLISRLYPGSKYFFFPYRLLYLIVYCQELLLRLIRKKPYLTRYRLKSSQNPVVYDSGKVQRQLGWQQRVSFGEAVALIKGGQR